MHAERVWIRESFRNETVDLEIPPRFKDILRQGPNQVETKSDYRAREMQSRAQVRFDVDGIGKLEYRKEGITDFNEK